MKKIVLCCLLSAFSLPLIGISQEKPVQTEDKGRVAVTGFARKKPAQSEGKDRVAVSDISREKTLQAQDKGSVVMLAQKLDAPMILYVINGKYYLGDATDILIRQMDVSKVKNIAEVKDEKEKARHSKKTGKFSKQVRDVFVIETDEKFEPSSVKPK